MKTARTHQRRSRPHATRSRVHETRGSALFLLLILAVVTASVMGAIYSYISTNSKAEKRSNIRLESTYAAEYAFEQAYQQLDTLIKEDTQNLPNVVSTSGATNLTLAPTSLFKSSDGYEWKTFLTVPVEAGAPIAAHTDFDPQQGVYKFMTIVEFNRKVPLMDTPVHMQFQREWNYTLTPLFKYAIFYDRDMELFPGAAFIVSGRVHSNGRIYTATDGASLTYEDFVTYVDGITYQRMDADPRGKIAQDKLKKPTEDHGSSSSDRQNPPGTLAENTDDTNANNDGSHELVELPNVHSTDPNAADRLYNNAGFKVLVNTTAKAVTAENGVTIPANSRVLLLKDGTAIPSTDPMAVYLNKLMAKGTFEDYREDKTFTTTDVDVGLVNSAYNAGGLPKEIPNTANWPNDSSVPADLKNKPIPADLRGKKFWNGVMYVTDVTNTSARRTGVKLINGTSLPDGKKSTSPVVGLTIATGNAAFIVGDYNTGGNPPVNGGAVDDDNHVAGYEPRPSAVIADAVTVVSSNWKDKDYNNQSSLNKRPATSTTINAALISGIVPTSKSAYSGGVENYIRLLEDWGGKRLSYYGSMINVYQSQQSTAIWQSTGAYYQAPSRNWHFDTQFLQPNRLPPGTPIVRSLARGQWVQIE